MDMKERSNNGIDYFLPMNFIGMYHDKPYIPNSEMAKELVSANNESKTIVNFYKKLFKFDNADAHVNTVRLQDIKVKNRINKYWWMEFNYKNNIIGISLFVDSTIEGFEKSDAIYSICLEVNDNKAKKIFKDEGKEEFHKHLNYPLPKENSFVYVAEINNKEKRILKKEDYDIEKIKAELAKGEFKKVRPCRLIECNSEKTNNEIEKDIIHAIYVLIENYSELLRIDVNDFADNEQLNIITKENVMENLEFDRNIILYGPPGTGKTRYTAIYAALIGGFETSKIKESIKKDIIIEEGKYSYKCDKNEKMSLDGLIERININENLYKEVFAYYKKISETKMYKDNKDYSCYQASFVTFHQSYSYEEFIEGIKPKTKNGEIIYEYKDGIFKSICKVAEKNDKDKFIIIIDEINRGNISKIFGEMITSIEDNRRYKFGNQNGDASNDESIKIILPYTKEKFLVPDNVYIIGTMNTADRSIALIDTALRRRFSFKEMIPKHDMLNELKIKNNSGKEISLADVLEKINQRVEVLLDREHTIGHAYFTHLLRDNLAKYVDIKEIGNVFKNKIIPLLQEYFYDDYEYIALTLGEDINSKEIIKGNEECNIIVKKPDDINILFNTKNTDKLLGVKPVYTIEDKAFYNFETYRQMTGK